MIHPPPADNVPGVPGIGDKGARDLVREFGPVEAVLANTAKVKRASYRAGLEQHREQALLSKHLVTLRTDAPIRLDLDALRRQGPDRDAAHMLFSELAFTSIAREFAPEIATAVTAHRLLTGPDAIAETVGKARQAGRVALALLTTEPDPMRARPVGLAFAWKQGEGAYVPLGHAYPGGCVPILLIHGNLWHM